MVNDTNGEVVDRGTTVRKRNGIFDHDSRD